MVGYPDSLPAHLDDMEGPELIPTKSIDMEEWDRVDQIMEAFSQGPSAMDLLIDTVIANAEEEFCEMNRIVNNLDELDPDVRTEMEEFILDRLAEMVDGR